MALAGRELPHGPDVRRPFVGLCAGRWRPLVGPGGGLVGAGPPSSTATRVTTTTTCADCSGPGTSLSASPAGTSSLSSDWAATVGPWSGRWPGSPGAAACTVALKLTHLACSAPSSLKGGRLSARRADCPRAGRRPRRRRRPGIGHSRARNRILRPGVRRAALVRGDHGAVAAGRSVCHVRWSPILQVRWREAERFDASEIRSGLAAATTRTVWSDSATRTGNVSEGIFSCSQRCCAGWRHRIRRQRDGVG